MDRYVVIGNPVAHSLSPEIHARFAEQTGEALEYSRLRVDEGRFAAEAARFFDGGGRGANVTLPFKEDAFRFASSRSERAQRAKAANFLVRRDSGEVHADNTDGAGLVTDLARNLHATLAGAALLVVGAGGAARGVIEPLLATGPRLLVVANRTASRARELAAEFAAAGKVQGVSLEEIPAVPFDIVINATSAAMRAEPLALPELQWAPRALAYDMAYGPAAQPFVTRAAAAGARASDGLGMLVEQAAESFFLWRGKRPATAAVIAALRERRP